MRPFPSITCCILPFVLVSHNPLPHSMLDPQSLCFLCSLCPECSSPRYLHGLLPSNLYSKVTSLLRSLLWQSPHSPQHFSLSSLLSFSLLITNAHSSYYCLFPLSRKKALGGWDYFLLCSLLNSQNLISCMIQDWHLV